MRNEIDHRNLLTSVYFAAAAAAARIESYMIRSVFVARVYRADSDPIIASILLA